jgi:hypothetical protein
MSADYEVPLTTVLDAEGNELQVVRRYTDGIMAGDPVKLVVYRREGEVVAQTPFYRDVLTHRASASELYVFQMGWTEFFFRKAWLLRQGALLPARGPRCYAYSLLANLRTRWLEHVLSSVLWWLAVLTYLSRVRDADTWFVNPGFWGWTGLVWLFLEFAYGGASLSIGMTVAVVAALPFARDAQEAMLIGCPFGLCWLMLRLLFLVAERAGGGIESFPGRPLATTTPPPQTGERA